MGYQVFPQPAAASSNDTIGFKAESLGSTGQPSVSLPTGISIWWSTTLANKGVYVSQPIQFMASQSTGVVRFGGANLTPSTTAVVSYALTTDATTVGFQIASNWDPSGYSAMTTFSNLTTSNVRFVKLVNGVYFIGNGSGLSGLSAIAISTDLNSWSRNHLGLSTSVGLTAATAYYGNNAYYVWGTFDGTSLIFSSTDLVNWATRSTDSYIGNESNAFYDTTLNRYFATGSTWNQHIKSSTNGVNWSTYGVLNTTAGTAYGIKKVNDFLITYGHDGGAGVARPLIEVSTNGINWTKATFPDAASVWSTNNQTICTDVTYGGGLYVAPMNGGQIVVSTDAINWTTTNYSTRSAQAYASIMYDGTYFMVGGGADTTAGYVWSTNGTFWNQTFSAITRQLSVASGFGSYAIYNPNAAEGQYKYVFMGQAQAKTNTANRAEFAIRGSRLPGGSSFNNFGVVINKYNLSVQP